MSVGTPVAADVPGIFDIVINSHGYMFARQVDPNLPFRTQRAKYSFTPTFIERTNTSGDFGDNQQDFFLTYSQNDWSLGDGQKFARIGDAEKKRRFWASSNIDISTEGQATLAGKIKALTFAASVSAPCSHYGGIYVASSTTLYKVDSSFVITSLGAHGAGGLPNQIVSDGTNSIYLIGGGTLRKCVVTGPTFTTFSANDSTWGCYVDQTLFGVSFGTLYKYDTAGVRTSVFPFKGADGGAYGQVGFGSPLVAYGGSALMVLAKEPGFDVYTADTTGVTQIASLPLNFQFDNVCVSRGIAFFTGKTNRRSSGFRAEVYYYNNGILDRLWTGQYATGTFDRVNICEYQNGLLWNDSASGTFIYYDLGTGATSSVGTFSTGGSAPGFGVDSFQSSALYVTGNSTAGSYFTDTTAADSGFISSSLIDFESSLDKYVSEVRVIFEAASDGNGGTVDIAYQLNSLDGAYTTLQTGAVSGTTYTIGQSCKNISIKITLNRGTSTLGPKLKRIYVRAAPVQQSFRNDEVIIDCTGNDGKVPVQLRNGQSMPMDGLRMAQNLVTAAQATTPFSITDRFGTYTGVIDGGSFDLVEVAPEEYYARFVLRQV